MEPCQLSPSAENSKFPLINQSQLELVDSLSHKSMQTPLAPVIWRKAKKFTIYDDLGHSWIDFTSAVAVANSGHSNPMVTAAIGKAIKDDLLTTFSFPHKNRLNLSKRVCDIFTQTQNNQFQCHFLCSGAEAIECAIDVAVSTTGRKKNIILSFINAFHGNTGKADLSSGSNEIGLIKNGEVETIFIKVPYQSRAVKQNRSFQQNVERAFLKYKLDLHDLTAILLEPYQGRGVFVLDKKYADEISIFCKHHGTLLIIDEIQSGFFRTGRMFGYQHFNLDPDIVCLGKGLTSSLPLSAVVAKKAVFEATGSLEVLTTHSANPISCAAAIANIDFLLSQKNQKKRTAVSEYFEKEVKTLNEFTLVAYVEALGFVGAIHISDNGQPSPEKAKKIVSLAFKSGLLLNAPIGPSSSYIRISPPLVISKSALKDGFKILRDSIEAIEKI